MATFKGFHGWKAEDYFDMTEVMKSVKPNWVSTLGNAKRYELQIYTMKTSNGNITTMAVLGILEASNGSFTYAPYSDFSERIWNVKGDRATEKNITKWQTEGVAQLDALKEKVKAFYEKPE